MLIFDFAKRREVWQTATKVETKAPQRVTLAEIARVTGGVLTGEANALVVDVSHDSRQAREGSLFVAVRGRSEEHTSELQSPCNLVCRLLLEKKKNVTESIRLCDCIS